MKTQTTLHHDINEAIFQSFFGTIPAPAWIADTQGHALYMNGKALEIWRLDHTYQNKHVYDLFPRDIADCFLASDQAVLQTGQPHMSMADLLHPDGSTGAIMINKVPLLSASGQTLIAGQAIDITDQVHTRKALLESNERFDIITKVISDCIWDCDMETGEVYRSEALMTLTGYSAEEIGNDLHWWEQKTHPDDREASIFKFQKALKEGEPYCDGEYRFLCADNQYRYFYDKGHIVYRDGKPVRAIGIVHDLTETKALEQKLLQERVQKQQEISQAIIATQDHLSNELSKELHDNVNQILATVRMMLYSVENNKDVCEGDCIRQCQDYVKMAMEEIRRISKTLNTSVIKDVGLLTSIEEIITRLEGNLPIRATVQCAPDIEQQLGNEHKLTIFRIIQEQVNNIIKHAEATEVSIHLSVEEDHISLTIKDNGKGFNPRLLKRGIGLANIRNRVEAFNGTCQIEACNGCVLKVTLPLCPDLNKEKAGA